MSAKTKSAAPKTEPSPAAPQPAARRPTGPQGEGPAEDDRLTEWVTDVFLPQYGKQAGMAVAVVAIAVIGWFSWKGIDNKRELTANRKLGLAFVHLTHDRPDSAAAALTDLLSEGPGGVAEAKAHLMLGKIRYRQGRLDDAIQSYSAVKVSTTGYPLIAAGALHGLAAAQMEKKEYAQAAETLERLVREFGRRSGHPEEKLAGQEVADPVPSLANALWKLTLCYRELKDLAKAKATAEKLVRIYPDTREGGDALRLLPQL